MADIQWGPSVGFLAGGLGIGALILWRLAAKAPKAAQAPGAAETADTLARRDLQARFDALIAQLRELDDTGGKRTAAQLASERRELELAAAATLMALDATPEPATTAAQATSDSVTEPFSAATTAAAPQATAKGSSLTGFFWGIGSAAALGLLFYFVSQSAQERAPSGSVTGNTPMSARPAPQSALSGEASQPGPAMPSDTELAALTARVRQNPEDLEARLELARLHLMRQDLMAVFDETREILQRDANNPRALSYQSLVRLAMGQADSAEQMLMRALQGDPGLLDAYVNLMMVYTSTGRAQEADTIFARAAQRFPERAESLRQLLGEMKARSGPNAGTPATGEDPHADVAVPGAAPATGALGPAPASASGSVGSSIAGVIELDPSAGAALVSGAVVFITLRVPGVTVGPPLAARRLVASSFPLAFEIGQGDSMTGAQIPDSVLVEIRLDTDGDLATRPRSDPYGRAEDVPLGTRNLRVSLKPRSEE